MQATVTLDSELEQKAKATMAMTGKPLDQVLTEAIRAGLSDTKPVTPCKFVATPRPLGLREGLSIDSIGQLLAQVEGEDYK